jgi:hypothetical protein
MENWHGTLYMKFWGKLLNTENFILRFSYGYLRHDVNSYASVNTNWARDIKFELCRLSVRESWITHDQLTTKFIHISGVSSGPCGF